MTCGLTLGSHLMIADDVSFPTALHKYPVLSVPIMHHCERPLPNQVRDKVWKGANATILGGVVEAKRALIGAHVMVVRDVIPYGIVGGVPARTIGSRLKSDSRLNV